MRPPPLWKLALAAAIIVAVPAVVTPSLFRLHPVTSMREADAKELLLSLRRGLASQRAAELSPNLRRFEDERVPFVVTVWVEGRRERVIGAPDRPVREAYAEVAKRLAALNGKYASKPRVRLQLDVVVAEGWIPDGGILAALAFVDGYDGLTGRVAGQRVALSPAEIVRQGRVGGFQPLPDFDEAFRIGLDLERVRKTMLHQAERQGVRGDAVTDLARARVLTVVEDASLEPRKLAKSTVERPALNGPRLEASVTAGAEYLVRALKEDGTYRYYYNPLMDRDEPGAYNWPRHAGVTYSLALVGRLRKDGSLLAAASRALGRFVEKTGQGPAGSRCLREKDKCYLGSSALGLLALAEYRIASGDGRYDDAARQIARFIGAMQREDGFFHHNWYEGRGIDAEQMKLYASQQAVLALARHARAVEDEDALARAEKGMDYLAGPYWDHFLGSYFFGQEHWSCLAAEEMYAVRPKPEYAKLCWDIGTYYDAITHNPGDTPFSEDAGGMSVTHVFTPYLGGTATAAEAMVSAWRLGAATGRDTSAIEAQLLSTLDFLARHEITVHDTFWMPRPDLAVGGFVESQTKIKIRIDNVQHAISAMVRARELFPRGDDAASRKARSDFAL